MKSLVELNGFTANTEGVFSSSQSESFDYSDGEEVERVLYDVLSNAKNLSSDSQELESFIANWPTEYHLSSSRANLLRCLDLSESKRVLELGCGCGSITRYLGEQEHLQVDSIEGSPSRAALAALRCRDLPNVNISCANFNDIKFPENHYDLILFVGVTEYAGRFSKKESDQEALQELLSLAKSASAEQGVILIAIENRTGLKYLQGATEDHYGIPYIGLDNYPESTGIRTYSKTEWQQQISESGFTHSEFLYPFPDYKIPNCIIHDRALSEQQSSTELQEAISKTKSRDYLQTFDLGDKEAELWKGVYQAGCLANFANSFLILLSNSSQSVKNIADFSIQQYSSSDFDFLSKTSSNQDSQTELRQQIEQIHDELRAITQSRGWRWMQRIRSIKHTLLRQGK